MENWLLMQTFYHGLTNSSRETMDAAAEVHSCHSPHQMQQLLWRRWPPTKVRMKNVFRLARERGIQQLKEVDMQSTKMDLLMKKLEDQANEKQEVMHIYYSCMTCEECGNTGHLGNNYPKTHEDVNFIINNNYRPQQNQGWNQQQRPNYQGNYQGNNYNHFNNQPPLRELISG